jgi:hypothetical protein
VTLDEAVGRPWGKVYHLVIPPLVTALAQEARRFGAVVVVRKCDHGVDHVDVFDTPASIAIRLWDVGFQPSLYRADYWRWCATAVDDDERTTLPPPPE